MEKKKKKKRFYSTIDDYRIKNGLFYIKATIIMAAILFSIVLIYKFIYIYL